MTIDFITFISRYSAEYAEFLKFTCEKFKSGENKINWKCIKSVGADRMPSGYKCVAETKDIGHNSMNHSEALNAAQKFVESEYAIFIDADMAIVYQNWDKIIIKELINNHCFGGSYGDNNKYKKFPTVYLFAFRSSILNEIKLDFSPLIYDEDESPVRYVVDNSEAHYFGMKPGELLKCDTGWQLPKIIKKAGFTSSSMSMTFMNSKESQLPFKDNKHKKFCLENPTHMCEWHYDRKLFATHKQASRNHPLTGIFGKAWKQRIRLYIKNMQ